MVAVPSAVRRCEREDGRVRITPVKLLARNASGRAPPPHLRPTATALPLRRLPKRVRAAWTMPSTRAAPYGATATTRQLSIANGNRHTTT
jgi:hypothetical protein